MRGTNVRNGAIRLTGTGRKCDLAFSDSGRSNRQSWNSTTTFPQRPPWPMSCLPLRDHEWQLT